jgi:hypothetical protein
MDQNIRLCLSKKQFRIKKTVASGLRKQLF